MGKAIFKVNCKSDEDVQFIQPKVSKPFNHCFQQIIAIVITVFVFVAIGQGQSETDITRWQTIIHTSTFKQISNPRKIDKKLLSEFPDWKKMSRRGGRFRGNFVNADLVEMA